MTITEEIIPDSCKGDNIFQSKAIGKHNTVMIFHFFSDTFVFHFGSLDLLKSTTTFV